MRRVCSDERCERVALYMIENNATVRSAAKEFGISKSTVHKDVTGTLKKYNYRLYLKVKKLLDVNKSERHVRGGEATRKKYSEMKLSEAKNKKTLP
ncbi:MAG: stage III sporulation protein D [Ruminococcaceae bacterium]|nr:stage III sporulation protein D [Oscillospiraceae bacterium]